jgi:hypothetical protein
MRRLCFGPTGSLTAFKRARKASLQVSFRFAGTRAEANIPTLMEMFSSMFGTYNAYEDHKTIRFYLVYGRRSEIEKDRQRRKRWQSVQAASNHRIIVMSYDRLYPKFVEDHRDLIVRSYQNRGFYVKGSVI